MKYKVIDWAYKSPQNTELTVLKIKWKPSFLEKLFKFYPTGQNGIYVYVKDEKTGEWCIRHSSIVDISKTLNPPYRFQDYVRDLNKQMEDNYQDEVKKNNVLFVPRKKFFNYIQDKFDRRNGL